MSDQQEITWNPITLWQCIERREYWWSRGWCSLTYKSSYLIEPFRQSCEPTSQSASHLRTYSLQNYIPRALEGQLTSITMSHLEVAMLLVLTSSYLSYHATQRDGLFTKPFFFGFVSSLRKLLNSSLGK